MQPFHYTAIKALSLTIGVTMLFISCSRDGDATQDGGHRELVVAVQMQNADWQTRSGGDGTSDAARVGTQVIGSAALDEQLEVVAECEPIGYAPAAPLTRGSLAKSTTDLRSLSFSVYTNSVFTKTLTATNNSGSWAVSDNILLDLDKNKYSYYAYAPVATVDNGLGLTGTTLTYIAPAEIAKQPDLCRATPVSNDKTGYVTFAMQHALTAVGVKVRADNVEISSIKLVGVNTSGALDLTSGTWTGLGGDKELTFPLTNTKPATGNGVADLTPSNGYLMLPPQPLSDDGKKLVIVYKYNGETTWRTGTHSLKTLTGGSWVAGQQVNYVIQLKAKFSLTLTPASATVQYTAGSYTFGYATGSSASSDPKATEDVDWITGFSFDRVNHKISFNYTANTKSVARQATITVTSGFTTQNFTFKQLVIDPSIRLSATAPLMGKDGGSYTTTVTTPVGVGWKVASKSNCSVSPESGSGSATVTITVPPTTWERNVSVTFSTNVGIVGVPEKTATWSGTQLYAYYINGIWWSLSNIGGTCDWNTAMTRCTSPWRLPSIDEAQSLLKSGQAQVGLGTNYYWSSTESGYNAYAFAVLGPHYRTKYNVCYVRCVRVR